MPCSWDAQSLRECAGSGSLVQATATCVLGKPMFAVRQPENCVADALLPRKSRALAFVHVPLALDAAAAVAGVAKPAGGTDPPILEAAALRGTDACHSVQQSSCASA